MGVVRRVADWLHVGACAVRRAAARARAGAGEVEARRVAAQACTGANRLVAAWARVGMGAVRRAAARVRAGASVAHARLRSPGGQMTVELAVAFPVLIVVAVIAVNACTFFSDCAVFDRVAREAVRVHAVSPAYRQGVGRSCDMVEEEIRSALDASNLEVEVSCNPAGFDLERFEAKLSFAPTLFGMGLRSEVFGVPLPKLTHSASYVVDVYKPGVIV